ncbi:30S ribosomal protein S16 [Buchnera aphidicola (Cinara tujafilina)]|uniref:Small ribosomal subunit protein bS16 n=1 Tax=Buchnera aphidicola (Cinara tujafilina) TaxID=261317 RepID=F7WZH6_9GAMM|nr:30S ribosomal protein S16 [Buchnera aphidicola]AEH39840.1 30S ribosomal protein S16 [Buchnera aphidicola (Cinara tujafilina)]
MIKIRLARHGVKKKPFYQIIVADIRSARNGKFIERLGFFNPFAKNNDQKIKLVIKRIKYWIKNGAKKSNRINNLLKQYKRKTIS